MFNHPPPAPDRGEGKYALKNMLAQYLTDTFTKKYRHVFRMESCRMSSSILFCDQHTHHTMEREEERGEERHESVDFRLEKHLLSRQW